MLFDDMRSLLDQIKGAEKSKVYIRYVDAMGITQDVEIGSLVEETSHEAGKSPERKIILLGGSGKTGTT
jgi:hypothetical protein